MDESDKERVPLNKSEDFTLCLNCGFPNHNSVAKCMFCKINLTKSNALPSWFRQTFLIIKWRWELQKDILKDENFFLFYLKKFWYLFLGIGLCGFGFYLFIDSIIRNIFSNGLISILLITYGFFTLKNLLSKK